MGKKPPSPCKVCGSNNHWDRECPDWNVYLECTKRNIMVVIETPEQEELDMFYHSAYCTRTRNVHKVEIEEIEDEYWANDARMPKARHGLIESSDSDSEAESDGEDINESSPPEGIHSFPIVPKPYKDALDDFFAETEVNVLAPPPKELSPIRLHRKRNPKPGDSALGISVLSVRGWIGDVENGEVDLRLDSCADISLVSENYHASMKNPPKIHEGHRMNLAQLTDSGTIIKGYMTLKILMLSEDGQLLEMEAEAYVVKGMSVPVLLGEDFQVNYEIGIARNVETVIRHRQHRRNKAAQRRKRLRLGAEGNLVRATTDVKIRPHTCKQVIVSGNFEEDREWVIQKNLLANSDDSFFVVPNTLISAKSPMVPASNLSDQPPIHMQRRNPRTRRGPAKVLRRTWVCREAGGVRQERQDLESRHRANSSEASAADSRKRGKPPPTRAHSNSDEARTYVRMNEGSGVPPSNAGVHIRLNEGSGVPPRNRGVHIRDEDGNVPGKDGIARSSEEDNSEDYGPKTAAMSDMTEYLSSKMQELLDIGSLPEHLKEKAWVMLRRRISAFGFDGRLGHVDAKAKKAYEAGLPPPKLTTNLSTAIPDSAMTDEWGASFDETVVHVERVVGYWSRLFKGAETRYSTTEREALAAKEGLVRFIRKTLPR
ncbi:hypothetical protein C8J57DRAFT_1230490 [Mycena rebaudengoi]|nr:hypothetical protein C8J57DRAFT_1230490 [Mycena rebaudengoi]